MIRFQTNDEALLFALGEVMKEITAEEAAKLLAEKK